MEEVGGSSMSNIFMLNRVDDLFKSTPTSTMEARQQSIRNVEPCRILKPFRTLVVACVSSCDVVARLT